MDRLKRMKESWKLMEFHSLQMEIPAQLITWTTHGLLTAYVKSRHRL